MDRPFAHEGGIGFVLRAIFDTLLSWGISPVVAARLHRAAAAKLEVNPHLDWLFVETFVEDDGARNSRVVEASSPETVLSFPLRKWREAWAAEHRRARESHPQLN